MNEIVQIMISYVAIIFLAIGIVQWLTAGFFFVFMKVRASQGRKVLVKVKSVTDWYFKAGLVSEGFLVYKARGQKEKKRIPLDKEQKIIFRSMSVWNLMIDEETNAFLTPDGLKAIDSFDAEKYEQLNIRALYKPALMDQNEKIMLGMIAVALLASVVSAFLVFKSGQKIDILQASVTALKDVASASVGIVG
jgi:hypothetical protein